MQSPRVQPLGAGGGTTALCIGVILLRCTGTSASSWTHPSHTGLAPSAVAGPVNTRALSALGHFEEMCPGCPQAKHLRSCVETLGALHSCDVWPFLRQFGHVMSRLSRGGAVRSRVGAPPAGRFL